ncbi:putative inorganic phosphate transporter 1-5 [Quercus suber]|uniref:Inorganic phosphate transporter 1-5 n=1 Tax=Quercus suber TaxID=58331 RepID=A0AAW0KKL3_QUESU
MVLCAICSGVSFGASAHSVIGTLFSMTISAIVLHFFKAPTFDENQVLSTRPDADYLWRIVLMLGALPALLTYYWRMKMPETC